MHFFVKNPGAGGTIQHLPLMKLSNDVCSATSTACLPSLFWTSGETFNMSLFHQFDLNIGASVRCVSHRANFVTQLQGIACSSNAFAICEFNCEKGRLLLSLALKSGGITKLFYSYHTATSIDRCSKVGLQILPVDRCDRYVHDWKLVLLRHWSQNHYV